MNKEMLIELGLQDTQAKAYLVLVEKGELTAPEVAALIEESRTNTYNILNKLASFGLVEASEDSKRRYRATNPVALEQFVNEKKKNILQLEGRVKKAMPQMLSYYYSFTEKPGVRLLQGIDGLKEIYYDILRTKADVYFLRTPKEVETLGEEFFDRYKKKRVALGIRTYAFTPDIPSSRHFSKDDESNAMIRHWLAEDDYTAPVEITVYGDKTAFMSYGDELMGVIIQSPPIAEAMRQIISLTAIRAD